VTRALPRRLVGLVALAVVAAATLTGGATAQTANLTLVGDKTKLVTDPATTKALLDNGIVPLPVGKTGFEFLNPSQVRYSFPLTGGSVNPSNLFGTIDHSGGLNVVNTNTGAALLLTNFRITIDANPGLSAEVNGDPSVRVRILDLDLKRAKVIAQGREIRVKNVDAYLTPAAAQALNATLGVTLFAPGLKLGVAQVFARVAA
jgi:hypothetical protein